ncbi:MAG: alpha/beta fold hydrolase [Gammaproteobacteria bacterium]
MLEAALAVEEVANANGIQLAFRRYGNPEHPSIVLIAGLGLQLVYWPSKLVQQLEQAGFSLVVFDNRDAGKSQHMHERGYQYPMWMVALAARMGMPLSGCYRVENLAADTLGLMDALGIEKAHVLGLSMGGMVAQALTIAHPRRVLSLTSIMSTTGYSGLPLPARDVLLALMTPLGRTRADFVEQTVQRWSRLAGTHFPVDTEHLRQVAASSYDRGYSQASTARQLRAILTSKARDQDLGGIRVPTLIIHGSADPLIHLAGGIRTAQCIPKARLEIIEGMGHALQPEVVNRIRPMLVEHLSGAA